MGADGGGNEPPPRDVDGKCPLDPYVITTDKCTFVDQQTLKLQVRRHSPVAQRCCGRARLRPCCVVNDDIRLSPYAPNSERATLQEAPEAVPTGEMPRHLLLAVERSLADRIAPGTRVSVLGVASIFSSAEARGGRGAPGAVAVRTPYLRVVGVIVHEEGSGELNEVLGRRGIGRCADDD